MQKKIVEMISSEKIEEAVERMAEELTKEYFDKDPVFIVILKGAFVFATHLLLKLNFPLNVDFMIISSYGDSRETSGNVRIEEDITINIENRHVVILEDIIDTGTTLKYLVQKLEANNPKSLKIAALLDKPSRRVCTIDADYRCFEIPNSFVVGFGLDDAQYYRNLPYIGTVTEE